MSRQTAADRRHERRLRVATLRSAVDKMAMRLAESEHSAGLRAGFGEHEKSNRHWRAARRRSSALRRLLDAFEAEVAR
ncbi:hypothetical protein AB0873_09450 [Micromonospora sp. NPDC047707]|uniref:hypothetical protein n=1 Tax=Micromonospora sp. NPDC047707 TaxID=3154498 RepID=UPI003454C7D8